jgi:Domain of unknown function (DUF4167)
MRDRAHQQSRHRAGNQRAAPGMLPFKGTRPRERSGSGFANAQWHYHRYLALAQAATLSGDAVAAQNFYQHAEHFFRTMRGQDL